MPYKHGVYVTQAKGGLGGIIRGTAGLQVVIGTAPVHLLENPEQAVNTPILANSMKEAVQALGYSEDFGKYTLCEAMSASFNVVGTGPLVLINVLNPAVHKAAIAETAVPVADGAAVLNVEGALPDALVVKVGDDALTKGTDYTLTRDGEGLLNIALTGETASAASVTVSGFKIDPTAVTASDIVGGVDVSTGAETGLEVLRQVYPKLGLVPGILTAPRWSMEPTVAAAMQAKTREINGVFRCFCFIDLSSKAGGALKYTDVGTAKTAQGIVSEDACAVWPCAAVGDVVYSGSALASALCARTDAENDDIPNVYPSNKTLAITRTCLADGTEVVLDQTQANAVNGFGVMTFLNMNGFRFWGNNTAAYPGSTDPAERWLSIRRFLNWAGNSFILSYFSRVDSPANKRLIDSIVDSENVRGNSLVARGACARYELVFNEEENSQADILSGKLTFHQYVAPFPPAEDIECILEFDAGALATALA